jgi:hypothetical protein
MTKNFPKFRGSKNISPKYLSCQVLLDNEHFGQKYEAQAEKNGK